MEKLSRYIESRFKMCEREREFKNKIAYFNQAFGALELYSWEHPGNGETLAEFWEEWRKKFISEIYD